MTDTQHTIEYTPLSAIRFAERNPKQHDLQLLGLSFRRFGFVEPIVRDERTGRLLAGHGRVEQLREQQQIDPVSPPRGVQLDEHGDWLVPVVRGYSSDDDHEAEAYLITSNRAVEAGGWDEALLSDALASLRESSSLEGVGFDDAELDAMLQRLAAELSDVDELSDELQRYTFTAYDKQLIVDAAATYWRQRGFPYPEPMPLHLAMIEINALAATADDELQQTRLGYHVADGYHPHRFDVKVTGKRSPVETFNDDELLRHAISTMLDEGVSFTELTFRSRVGLTRGAQTAANFRPGFALSMLRRFAPRDAHVLDCSTGFGGRLVGFLASHCGMYVGIDPATQTHSGNMQLAAELSTPTHLVQLLNLPAEDVRSDGMPRCQMAFTSPPYFVKERYADETTQSYARYPQIEAWRDGFLTPMLKLQHDVLDVDAVSVINIADVKVGSVTHPLVEMTCECARAVGFDVLDVEQLPLSHRWGSPDTEAASEPVIVMRRAGA